MRFDGNSKIGQKIVLIYGRQSHKVGMANNSDLAYLQSVEGKRAIVTTHVEGIIEWLSI